MELRLRPENAEPPRFPKFVGKIPAPDDERFRSEPPRVFYFLVAGNYFHSNSFRIVFEPVPIASVPSPI